MCLLICFISSRGDLSNQMTSLNSKPKRDCFAFKMPPLLLTYSMQYRNTGPRYFESFAVFPLLKDHYEFVLSKWQVGTSFRERGYGFLAVSNKVYYISCQVHWSFIDILGACPISRYGNNVGGYLAAPSHAIAKTTPPCAFIAHYVKWHRAGYLIGLSVAAGRAIDLKWIFLFVCRQSAGNKLTLKCYKNS